MVDFGDFFLRPSSKSDFQSAYVIVRQPIEFGFFWNYFVFSERIVVWKLLVEQRVILLIVFFKQRGFDHHLRLHLLRHGLLQWKVSG